MPVRAPPSAAELEARQAYLRCLSHAAHYADRDLAPVDNVALIVAPMCYPQFADYEVAMTEGLNGHWRRSYQRASDQLQIELASEVIRQERSKAAVSASR